MSVLNHQLQYGINDLYIQFPFLCLMVQLLPEPIVSKMRNYFSALRQR